MHIDTDGIVQLKGRAICLIDTGDELLVTELMFMVSLKTIS
jgi:ATP-dependent RNA helicase DOB1